MQLCLQTTLTASMQHCRTSAMNVEQCASKHMHHGVQATGGKRMTYMCQMASQDLRGPCRCSVHGPLMVHCWARRSAARTIAMVMHHEGPAA
eukprot:357292-Chlamydomonas_euryale.AAC.4